MEQTPGESAVDITPQLPGIFSEDGGKTWAVRDHEGNEFGPYATTGDAQTAFDRSEDDRLGRRHLASQQLEKLLLEFLNVDSQVATAEENLKDLKARRKLMAENEMIETATPEEAAAGVRLSNGSEWTFEQQYHCAIRIEDKPAAFQYLIDNQQGGMLRRTLTISFGKDSAVREAQIRDMIKKMLPEYEISLRVGKAPELLVEALQQLLNNVGISPVFNVDPGLELPGATMRAWVVKNLKQGKSLPDVFTVYAPLQPKMAVMAQDSGYTPGGITLTDETAGPS